MMEKLLDDGLDFEEVDTPVRLGPTLTPKELSDPQKIADLNAKGIKIIEIGRGSNARFHLEKTEISYRFCFNLARANKHVRPGTPIDGTGLKITPDSLCGASAGQKVQPVRPPGQEPGVHVLLRSPVPKLPKTGPLGAAAQTAHQPRILALRMRSVAGILYYLGEIARSDLGLSSSPFVPRVGRSRAVLFSLLSGPGGPSAITVSYQGRGYHVPIDVNGTRNRSGQVLDLVAELLALNSSAKNLPAPNIIPVISR